MFKDPKGSKILETEPEHIDSSGCPPQIFLCSVFPDGVLAVEINNEDSSNKDINSDTDLVMQWKNKDDLGGLIKMIRPNQWVRRFAKLFSWARAWILICRSWRRRQNGDFNQLYKDRYHQHESRQQLCSHTPPSSVLLLSFHVVISQSSLDINSGILIVFM